MAALAHTAREAGTSVLLITHDAQTAAYADREVTLQVWDPDIGMLWVFAMSSLGVYGIVLAGWSSGSKYPLLGAVRGSAQMVSYEAALGLAVVTVVMMTGSLSSGLLGSPSKTFTWAGA
jgi:NADH-quinone oxidoreductase subunit H